MAIEATHEALIQRQSDHVALAVERGGLPTEHEAEELYKALAEAFNLLESLAYRIEGIGESAYGHDVPPITLEAIGVATLITSSVELQLEQCEGELKRISRSMLSLMAIREEQARTREDGEDG